eukprot:6817412-Alexandrium_andersonii.AAC.1
MRIRADLFDWYTKREAQYPTEAVYKLQDLTPEMLGTRAHKTFRLKAAETKTLLIFTVEKASLHQQLLPKGSLLVLAGQQLVNYFEIIKGQGLRMSTKAIQELRRAKFKK